MNDNANKQASILRRQTWRMPALCLALLATHPQAGAITLDELVKAAAFNNPAALSRQRAAEAAAEGVSSAQWQFFPTPSVSVERAGTTGQRDISYGGDASVVITAPPPAGQVRSPARPLSCRPVTSGPAPLASMPTATWSSPPIPAARTPGRTTRIPVIRGVSTTAFSI